MITCLQKESYILSRNQNGLVPWLCNPKKHDPKKFRVCVDYRWLNKDTKTDPFPTPFANEILNEVAGHEFYSLTDGFSGYNQVPITKEDQHKTTFVCEFGSFAYKKMHFGLKNAPVIFSRIVVKAFQEYIYKSMGVCFDEWRIYSMLKDHIKWLRIMLEICRQIQLSLNIKSVFLPHPLASFWDMLSAKMGSK